MTTLGDKLQVPKDEIVEQVDAITLSKERIRVALKASNGKTRLIEIPRTRKSQGTMQLVAAPESNVDQKLVKSIVRAHAWLDDLASGRHATIQDLATAVDIHPKVVRQGLRLAFLPPDLTRTVFDGKATIALKQIPKFLPLSWLEQYRAVG